MSDLTVFRDHCRRMATVTELPRPKGHSMSCWPFVAADEDHGGCQWGWQTCNCACHDDERPQPPTAAERALWTRLADEIDTYLAGHLKEQLVDASTHTEPLWETP